MEKVNLRNIYKKWYFWLVIAILILGIIGATSSINNSSNDNSNNQQTEQTLEYFQTDKVVNDFFVEFNKKTTRIIQKENISMGNIRTKAIVNDDYVYMVLIHVESSNTLEIQFNVKTDDGYLLDYYSSIIKVYNSDVSSLNLSHSWDNLVETKNDATFTNINSHYYEHVLYSNKIEIKMTVML